MTDVSESGVKLVISQEDTKEQIRSKVWAHMKATGLTSFPIPPKRISNFKGSDEAGGRIAEMEVFKKASVVRVDPVRPLQEIRLKTLGAGKTLLLPTPRLLNHVHSKVVAPQDADLKLLKEAISREGVKEYSTPIDLDEKLMVDLVIVGCIAVSPNGRRIGKGGGLSDLEYAMMASLGVVDERVPVVTMVHDEQVIELPEGLFQAHDLPVDFIVTPTRVIECSGVPKRPSGVIWNLLNDEYMNHVPVLKRIRFRDWKLGKAVKLADEEAEPTELADVVLDETEVPEERRKRRPNRNRRVVRRRDAEEGETTGDEERREIAVKKEGAGRRRQGRNDRNRNRNKKPSDRLGSDGVTDDEKRKDGPNGEVRQGRRQARYQGVVEGSVYVGSLPRSLRVSQFKSRVRERMVNPLRVLWKGQQGFAFLNFKTLQDAEQALTALEGLSISDRALKLEMAKSATGRRSREVPQPAMQADEDKAVE